MTILRSCKMDTQGVDEEEVPFGRANVVEISRGISLQDKVSQKLFEFEAALNESLTEDQSSAPSETAEGFPSLGDISSPILLSEVARNETWSAIKIVRRLPDVEDKRSIFKYPLHTATKKGQVNLLQRLLKNGGNPLITDFDQRTLLHHACGFRTCQTTSWSLPLKRYHFMLLMQYY